MSGQNSGAPISVFTQLVYVLVLVVLVPTGIAAWVNGREVGYGLIVVAVAVVFAGERVAASIRGRR